MDYVLLLLSLSSILYLGVIGRSAMASDLDTWQAALANTQMPKSLLDILQPSGESQKALHSYHGVGKTALNLNDNDGLGSVFPTVGKDSYSIGPNRGPHKGPHKPANLPSDVTTFFLESDLHSGKKMNLFFPKPTTTKPSFLPGHVADEIPFSSEHLSDILSQFSVEPESKEAEIMKETIEDCESPSVRGEDKYCATSLHSLIDFGVSKLGREVEVFATEVVEGKNDKNNNNGGVKQVYRIGEEGVRKIGDRSVVCHKQNYVYAVFYCHEVQATRAYVVSLVGDDGSKAEAVAVCHTDTRYWSAELLVFKVLNVKPGTLPVCHFLPNDNLVWVPK